MSTKQEVIDGITKYINEEYAGDWTAAFNAEATDGKIGSTELQSVLKKARIGYIVTRTFIASQIIAAVDTDKDGLISLEEFLKIVQ